MDTDSPVSRFPIDSDSIADPCTEPSYHDLITSTLEKMSHVVQAHELMLSHDIAHYTVNVIGPKLVLNKDFLS